MFLHSRELPGSSRERKFAAANRIQKVGIFLIMALLFTITFGIQTAHGQSQIHGVILDDSDKPVSNASVLLINAFDSSDVMRTMATENGIYLFNNIAIGDYVVKVTAVGFEDAITPMYSIVTGQDIVNAGMIRMRIKGTPLSEVIVKTKKPLFEQRIDRTIINVKSSITSAGTNALDILEKSPGVMINRQNNSISLGGKEGEW